VAGVAGTLIVTGDDEPAAAVLARTALEPLPAKSGRGEATLAGTGADRTLRVDVTGLAAADGFYEVWVLDPKTLQMQSLGVLRGVKGDFAVPAGLDLRKLSVVDVSLEPYDGDPAHSRNSVVRGALPT
jgi:anti-sigma-K factor RskA